MSGSDKTVADRAGSSDPNGLRAGQGGRGPQRIALIGIAALVAIGLLLAILINRPGDDPIAEASPSPTGSSALSPNPTDAATPAGTIDPTGIPTPAAPATVPESWSGEAVFVEPGVRYVLGDLVTWSEGLVAVGTRYEDESRNVFGPPPAHTGQVWRANGIDWSRLGDMPLVEADPTGLQCAEAPGSLHGLATMTVAGTVMSGICGEGAVLTAGGSYVSADGAEWTRLPFGDRAYAAGAVIVGDRVVIGTDSRTGQAESLGVTFWISGAP